MPVTAATRILLTITLLLPGSVLTQAPEAREAVRGITISTHGGGRDWGTDRIIEAFKAVKAVGANWVTVHPYGWIRRNGEVGFRARRGDDPPRHWTRPIQEAQKLGLKILIKPHLGYWGSGFSWRGAIAFESPEEWQRFFTTYERWIVRLARACKDADAFCVGTELEKTIGYEKEWRRVIAAVRKQTSAPVTYAANWTVYQKITWWDALDAVGIQAYFPVAERPSARLPEIQAGWGRRMKELRAFARRTGKSIVFTELGYNRSFNAPVRPWEYHTDGREAAVVQQRCLDVALRAIEAEPSVIGCFLWKWFPPPRPVGRNFQLATPELKRVIRTIWRG